MSGTFVMSQKQPIATQCVNLHTILWQNKTLNLQK